MTKTAENLIKSQDVIGLAVFSVAEGQKLGVIKDIFLEPGKKSPLFLVEDEEWYKGGKVIKGSDVIKIGEEALVIESKDKMEHFSAVSNIESMLRMNTDLTSISVINPAEDELGKINEYLIDKEKIEVVSLEVKNGEGAGLKCWPAENISGVKGGAVVVSGEEQSDEAAAETEPETKAEGLIPTEEEHEEKPEEKVEEKAEEKPEEQVEDKVEEKPEDLSKKAATGNGEEKEDKKVVDKENIEKPEVQETMAVAAHKDLKQILEERQDKFLLGKKVDRDITADDGTIIIQKGETITKEVLEDAKGAHKYIVLSFCVKTDLVKRS